MNKGHLWEETDMQWLTILLIGVAANIDNLGIGFSFGLKLKRIPFLQNLLIGIISMLLAYISMAAGSLFSNYFSQAIANIAGGSLILALGLWIIFSSLPLIKNNAHFQKTAWLTRLPKLDKTKNTTWKETVFLGFVLGINCLAIGFGAGFTGVSPLLASISIGAFSIISISFGVLLGNSIGNTLIGRYSTIFSGLLLIIIGIYEIII